jgi:hypothetical protein
MGGFDPFEPDEKGFLPHHYAASHGHLSLLQWLLSRFSIPVDTPAALCGCTALHAAAVGGCFDTVQWLVWVGADLYATRQCPDGKPRSASKLASGCAQEPIAIYLRERENEAKVRQLVVGGQRRKRQRMQ